jgi:hypothetical protein
MLADVESSARVTQDLQHSRAKAVIFRKIQQVSRNHVSLLHSHLFKLVLILALVHVLLRSQVRCDFVGDDQVHLQQPWQVSMHANTLQVPQTPYVFSIRHGPKECARKELALPQAWNAGDMSDVSALPEQGERRARHASLPEWHTSGKKPVLIAHAYARESQSAAGSSKHCMLLI